jgi:hypothetical protein
MGCKHFPLELDKARAEVTIPTFMLKEKFDENRRWHAGEQSEIGAVGPAISAAGRPRN